MERKQEEREKEERDNQVRVGLKSFHVSPEKATVHVGETLPIEVRGCIREPFMDALANLFSSNSSGDPGCYYGDGSSGNLVWMSFTVEKNIGYVTPFYHADHVIYQAPSEKPKQNVVNVFCRGANGQQ